MLNLNQAVASVAVTPCQTQKFQGLNAKKVAPTTCHSFDYAARPSVITPHVQAQALNLHA